MSMFFFLKIYYFPLERLRIFLEGNFPKTKNDDILQNQSDEGELKAHFILRRQSL